MISRMVLRSYLEGSHFSSLAIFILEIILGIGYLVLKVIIQWMDS
jgi:hypothetical protein